SAQSPGRVYRLRCSAVPCRHPCGDGTRSATINAPTAPEMSTCVTDVASPFWRRTWSPPKARAITPRVSGAP
ncbi:unnamed protein product, partial [Candidula unifasciata]